MPDPPLISRPEGGLIRFSYPANTITYRYNRSTNTYRRSVTGEGRQIDAADGKRIQPKNVIIMFVRFGQIGDRKHRLEADLIGRGKALINVNGRTIVGTWRKSSITKPTRFYDRAGNQVTLTRGQTFVQVVPRGTKVRIVPGKDVPPPDPSAAPSGSAGGSASPTPAP